MKWWNRRKEREGIGEEVWSLPRAVEQAKRAWQDAQERVGLCEKGEEDDAIYRLKLAEKRYVFLLSQARAEFAARSR